MNIIFVTTNINNLCLKHNILHRNYHLWIVKLSPTDNFKRVFNLHLIVNQLFNLKNNHRIYKVITLSKNIYFGNQNIYPILTLFNCFLLNNKIIFSQNISINPNRTYSISFHFLSMSFLLGGYRVYSHSRTKRKPEILRVWGSVFPCVPLIF